MLRAALEKGTCDVFDIKDMFIVAGNHVARPLFSVHVQVRLDTQPLQQHSETKDGNLAVDGHKISLYECRDPAEIPCSADGADISEESTGTLR